MSLFHSLNEFKWRIGDMYVWTHPSTVISVAVVNWLTVSYMVGKHWSCRPLIDGICTTEEQA